MIVVITSCGYFKKGFGYIIEEIRREHHSFSEVRYVNHIREIHKKSIAKIKAIIVDYGDSNTQLLSELFDFKSHYPESYIVLITRERCYESTIDNIIINSISEFSIDCKAVIKKISSFLENFKEGNQKIVITKNMKLYHLEKEAQLSQKEVSLLPYIMFGKKNKEISRQFNLSEKTVCHHRRNVYKKFAVENLAGLYHKIEEKD
ncbi:LuxR C-terminal-related transcriptional regulator [Citrobacter sedlakii]|uniref:LuxR C-terminal-related transcriptional regulator n=1 Tax=Citrobacter sedlakii TaxID=67826 RepID=UPI0031395440